MTKRMSLAILLLITVASADALIADDGACKVLSYFSFSKPRFAPFTEMYNESTLPKVGYSLLAAAEMAREQFNARDASIVLEMEELTRDCSVYIPEQALVDGELSQEKTMKSTLSYLKMNDAPCAVMGPMPFVDNDVLKQVTNALDIPHLIYWEVHQHLLDFRASKSIISTIPSPRNVADIVLEFLGGHLGRRGMAILHENPDLSADMAEEFVNYGPKHGMQNVAFKRWSHDTDEDLDKIIQDIKQYGLKTIFLNILSKEKTVPLAEALDREGMLESDSGYLYILSTHYMKLDALNELYGETLVDSLWDKLLSSSMVFDERIDGFRSSDDTNDRFLASWRQQNSTMVEHLKSIHPIQQEDDPYFYSPNNDFFQTNLPSNRASLAYDAMMSIGLGACQAQAKSAAGIDKEKTKAGDQRLLQPPGPPPVSKNHVHKAIVDSVEFTGATGFVSYEEPVGQRTKDSSTVGIYNIRPIPSSTTDVIDGTPKYHSYEAVLTAVYKSKNGGWKDEASEVFIYKDGRTVPPSGDLEVQENNYLSSWVRALGFTFMVITWTLSLACIAGICMFRKANAVRGGQPPFLQLICASSIITSTAILTLSFDEGSGWTNHQLNIACSLTPWFFVIGQILLASCLWAKLWRINKVMQFRRQTVTIQRASIPIAVVLVLALIILISWTIVDPWVWERVFVQAYPLETYGRCTCDNFWAFFGPLIALVVVVDIIVTLYAWKSLDIAEELGDSRAIFFALFTQLQAWVVGIPILIVVHQTSADGTYLGRAVLIWIFACSPLVILIVPKIYRAFDLQRNPNRKSSRGNIGASAGSPVVRVTGLSVPVADTNNSSRRTNNGSRRSDPEDDGNIKGQKEEEVKV